MDNYRIIGVDPGSKESGMCVLDGSTIIGAFNLSNSNDLCNKVTNYLQHDCIYVVIEDIKPYSLQLTPQVIDTCKFIGEFCYRLKTSFKIDVKLLSRYEVKKWCFDSFPHVSIPLIERKIDKKMFPACIVETKLETVVDTNGKGKRKASFNYVDDKVVMECMKDLYKIPLPKAGMGYDFGLQTHSWQALSVATCFKQMRIPSSLF